jgi:tRNA threonylcarbamoyladenosine biosynthesis protein TsaE
VERSFLSRSPAATEALGDALGRAAFDGLVIALDGDLGTGKTTFVRGLARGLGVTGDVASPTYALLSEHAGRLALHHFDAWMEGRERAFLADGGAEILAGGGVSAVEWAARVASALPREHLGVRLAHRGPTLRSIRLAALGQGETAARLARIVRDLPAIAGLEPEP